MTDELKYLMEIKEAVARIEERQKDSDESRKDLKNEVIAIKQDLDDNVKKDINRAKGAFGLMFGAGALVKILELFN